jgi:hypothetical protein
MRSMMAGEEVIRLAAANCAGAYRTWADRLGRRTEVADDLSCADLELSVSLPPNNATLLRKPRGDATGDLLERIAAFFVERPGGPYQIWSLWPIPSLIEAGTAGEPVPCMLRDAGGPSPALPNELSIFEADDQTTLRDAEALIDEVFEARSAPGSLLALECLDERFRVWVGYVGGRPVTTSTAYGQCLRPASTRWPPLPPPAAAGTARRSPGPQPSAARISRPRSRRATWDCRCTRGWATGPSPNSRSGIEIANREAIARPGNQPSADQAG